MKENLDLIFTAFVCLAASFLLGFCTRGAKVEKVYDIQRDTLTVRDTITEYVPQPVYTYLHDTIEVVSAVYEVVNDTVYVTIPKEYKQYHSDDYDVTISGYRPVLEQISVYPTRETVTVYATEPAKAKKWGLGIHAGYGMTPEGLRPVVSLGVSYNLIRF